MHEMLPKRPASLLELIADAMDSDDDDHSPLLRYVCDKAPPSKTAHARIKRQRSNAEDFHLCQDEHGYHITLAAPGLRTNDLSISIENGVLQFKGETKSDRCHVAISRSLRLPKDADFVSDKVETAHVDGIISVHVPRRVQPSPRILNILAATPLQPQEGEEGAAISKPMDMSGYTFTLAAPGVKSADLTVSIEDGVLQLKGESKGVTHRQQTMKIDRKIRLPADADVDSEEAAVTHADGLITVYVPRRAPAKRDLILPSCPSNCINGRSKL